MIPQDWVFWWYSGALLLLGPFGFVVGPLMARRASPRAALRYPVEARLARARHGVRSVAVVGHGLADTAGRLLGVRAAEWAFRVPILFRAKLSQ